MTSSRKMAWLCILTHGTLAFAAEVREGWRADFDNGTLSGAVKPHYILRGAGKADDSRMIFEIKDGVVTLGARFDEASARGSGDYVPLSWRDLNAEEQKREDEWIALLKDYDPGEPAVLREFFPFGVYAGPPDTSSKHQYFHRQTFGIMAGHHMNFFMAGAPHRRDGQWLPGPLERTQPIVAAARETGVRVNLRMRRCTDLFDQQGADAIRQWAEPVIQSIGDRPEVLGYDVGDETPLAALHGIAAAVAVLRQLDPKRPSMLCFWDPASIRAYDPYVPVNVSDIYPLQDGRKTTAAYMYEWCRGVARDSGNKRHWIVLQSFGSAPWRPRRAYIVPTVEELRLMTWASIAGGARGIIYYSFSYDRYKMIADQWGNPNELMGEIGSLGEGIIPIGRRLLDAVVDIDSPIHADNKDLIVGVLHAPKRDARYIIIVNKNTGSPQGGTLADLPGKLFDLSGLREVAGGAIEPLRPGDGRAYLVGSAGQFQLEADAIRANRLAEAERAKTPDRTLARNYGDDLPWCVKIKAGLDEIGQLMGSVEPAMFDDNPDPNIVATVEPHRVPYWSLHAPWAKAYDDLLRGKGSSAPLADRVAKLAADARKIVATIRAALGDRPMYPGRR